MWQIKVGFDKWEVMAGGSWDQYPLSHHFNPAALLGESKCSGRRAAVLQYPSRFLQDEEKLLLLMPKGTKGSVNPALVQVTHTTAEWV